MKPLKLNHINNCYNNSPIYGWRQTASRYSQLSVVHLISNDYAITTEQQSQQCSIMLVLNMAACHIYNSMVTVTILQHFTVYFHSWHLTYCIKIMQLILIGIQVRDMDLEWRQPHWGDERKGNADCWNKSASCDGRESCLLTLEIVPPILRAGNSRYTMTLGS